MLAKEISQHHCRGNLDEFRRLKLTEPGNANPAAVTVYLQANPWDQNNYQQYDAENVEGRRDVQDLTIIRESHYQHCHQGNAETDQLFYPVALSWLRVADLIGSKPDNADSQKS